MAFIRTKTIKGKEYAYLVKNKWTRKGPRQSGSKYLGPVTKVIEPVEHELERFDSFDEYVLDRHKTELEDFFDKAEPKVILNEIIAYDLKLLGFKDYFGKKGSKKDSLILGDCVVDLNNLKVTSLSDGKPCVISMNGDFFCDYTVRKIYNFLEFGNELDIAKKLAKTFISAGIPIEDRIFVLFFKRNFKDGKLKIG